MPYRLNEATNALRESLAQAMADSFVAPVWGEPQAMTLVLKAVQKSFDSAEVAASEQSIAKSVWAFRKSGKAPSFRDLKYVCYGLGLHQGKDESTLLGDEELFPALLDEIHALTTEPRRFRKCYQGLLSSYLNFPADESASTQERKHWEHLRAYLRKQLAVIRSIEPVASWIKVLEAHENLLQNQPCQRYAAALRKGRWDELAELAAGLAISSESWVWKEAVLAHVQTVSEIHADSTFRQELDLALHALTGSRVALGTDIRKAGAASLLRRYARCGERPQHDALLDLALQCFGKPWLHATAWDAYVGDEEAVRLIDSWIKTGLIQDFFQLLAEDGVADRSRMLFWPQFVPIIDDIWFAMGSHAYDSHDPKYIKLRQRIGKERTLQFAGSSHTNNAFIMRIGPFFMIEFGQKGRAAYLIHADNWKGDLRPNAAIELEAWRLKGMGGRQMTHMPTDTWSQKFCDEICPRIGWWPGAPVPKANKPKPGSAITTAKPETASSQKPASAYIPLFNEDPVLTALKTQLRRFDLEIEDLRKSGGCLWIRKDTSNPELTRVLLGRGFNYTEGKGWWKK